MVRLRYSVDKKKLACVLSVLGAGIFFGYFFLLSWVLGFLVTSWGAGAKTGERGRVRSIIIPFGRWRIHFHHWVIALLLIGLSFIKAVPYLSPAMVYGFLGGIAIQGIYSYTDWYRVLLPRRDEVEAEKAAIPEAQPG
ncbi:MAG: hypothetical protein SVP26_08225 [Chloroflexota bacterium]|nr:hypothetical protein [Chloroflexota bacterium]